MADRWEKYRGCVRGCLERVYVKRDTAGKKVHTMQVAAVTAVEE